MMMIKDSVVGGGVYKGLNKIVLCVLDMLGDFMVRITR